MEVTAKRIKGFEEIEDDQVSYFKHTDGIWYVYLPGCGVGNIVNHTVEEHEDGTITVSPSILMWGHKDGQRTQFHGFLIKGVWKDA
jgi:hypothetical protein